jgi:hypothetical protein
VGTAHPTAISWKFLQFPIAINPLSVEDIIDRRSMYLHLHANTDTDAIQDVGVVVCATSLIFDLEPLIKLSYYVENNYYNASHLYVK